MDHWRQYNPALVPQQGQPATLRTNDQPRRPLAINDMLNHGPAPPRWFGDARSATIEFPAYAGTFKLTY